MGFRLSCIRSQYDCGWGAFVEFPFGVQFISIHFFIHQLQWFSSAVLRSIKVNVFKPWYTVIDIVLDYQCLVFETSHVFLCNHTTVLSCLMMWKLTSHEHENLSHFYLSSYVMCSNSPCYQDQPAKSLYPIFPIMQPIAPCWLSW